ncbi:MAG: hypothetical protein WCT07_01885 [Candidatus Paceibacterota bacterium]|jgi:hypothetical protein
MIYAIVGTDINKREKAYEALKKVGGISAHVYSEQIATLEALVEATSLFGEKIVVNLIQVMDVASSRDELIRLLPDMKDSQNIFIIDEPFADANRFKRLEKYSEKIFDAREGKEKDADVFTLCNLFAKRDKKGAWIEWVKVKDTDSPEAFQGALWWKMKTIWEDTLNGKPSKFSKHECEVFASRILRSSIEAHRGGKKLDVALEEIILSL